VAGPWFFLTRPRPPTDKGGNPGARAGRRRPPRFAGDPALACKPRPKPPRAVRKLRLIRPISWLAIAVLLLGALAAALIGTR